MLNFKYYLIDVGQNYCYIYPKHSTLNCVATFKERSEVKATLARKLVLLSVKKKVPIFSLENYKVVYINKLHKRRVSTSVENTSTHELFEPLVSTKKYDIYIVQPGQRVNVECVVIEGEIEIRSICYEDIVSRCE